MTAVEIKDITLPENMQRDGQGGRARLRPEKAGVLVPLDDGSVLVKRGQCDVLTCTDQVLLQSLFVTSKSAPMAHFSM